MRSYSYSTPFQSEFDALVTASFFLFFFPFISLSPDDVLCLNTPRSCCCRRYHQLAAQFSFCHIRSRLFPFNVVSSRLIAKMAVLFVAEHSYTIPFCQGLSLSPRILIKLGKFESYTSICLTLIHNFSRHTTLLIIADTSY